MGEFNPFYLLSMGKAAFLPYCLWEDSVLDLVSQVRDVILVMCIFSSGKPQGVGILEWKVYGEGDGNGEISLRATWDRG